MKIKFIENFLSDSEIKEFLDLYEHIDDNKMWQKSDMEFWQDRIFDLSVYLETFKNKEKQKFFMNILKRMRSEMISHFELDSLIHADTMQLVKWKDGSEQGAHADSCNDDGSDNFTAWREYSAVIYLNDDYDGGETYFTNYEISVEPQAGGMLMFMADLDHRHGVNKVINGERKTLITFWSKEVKNRMLRLP